MTFRSGKVKLPPQYKLEKGKQKDEVIDWIRAQRVLIYFNHKISLKEAINFNHIYMSALREHVIEIEGAYETLKYLSNKYKIIIVTNGPSVATTDKIRKIKCLDFVDDILSADMFGYMKPHLELINGIKQVVGNKNHKEYLIIGNSLKSDIQWGMNVNIDTCWFNIFDGELEKEYKPTFIIKELIDLKTIL